MSDETPSIGVMLGAAGGCPEVEFKGKTWKVGHPTQTTKATLERLVVAKATREITALKQDLPPNEYAEMFEGHRKAVSAGKFKTWSEDWQAIAFAPENLHFILLSLLRENHPEASERDAKDLFTSAKEDVEIALAQVVPDFFTLLYREHPQIKMYLSALKENRLTEEQKTLAQTAIAALLEKFSSTAVMPGIAGTISSKVSSSLAKLFAEASPPTNAPS
jgi:hypothetical protein